MEVTDAIDTAREALLVAMIVSAPVLLVGLVVGLVISIAQTVTQLQDQTLNTVPKIVAMVGAGIVLTPWIAERLITYSRNLFAGV